MNAYVNENCIGCGVCVGVCEDVFQMKDDGFAEAIGEVPEEFEALAKDAGDSCPVDAIELGE